MSFLKRSHLAGTWYAGTRSELHDQVQRLLEAGRPPTDAPARWSAVIVPHAGYAYSGRAAAAGYRSLRGQAFGRVVIVAPSHFGHFSGAALLDVDAFETPLGLVPVDRDAVARLAGTPLWAIDARPFAPEHSLEIQLPFLQAVLPTVRVVPVLVGRVRPGDYSVLARRLATLQDGATLFLISSDFTHYGRDFDYLPFPPTGADAVRVGLRLLDLGALEHVCAGEVQAFDTYVEATGATICGRLPIALWLSLHAQRSRGRVLAYETSLDVTGEYEHSVSYACVAFPA